MKVKNISPFLIIDEFPEKPNRECIYLFSRPRCIPPNCEWPRKGAQIYTTNIVKNILVHQNQDLEGVISCLRDNGDVLKFKDGKKVTVKIHQTDSKSGNSMFLFEGKTIKTTFYTGCFTEYRSVLLNESIYQCISDEKIDELLIDNSMIDAKNFAEHTCFEIRLIFSKFPEYKMHLLIDQLGFEDLILLLSAKYRYSVYIKDLPLLVKLFGDMDLLSQFNIPKQNADIILVQTAENISIEGIRRLFSEEKILTVKLASCPHIKKICDCHLIKDALHIVHYEPHPSLFDAYSLVKLIRPRVILPIFDDGPKIPKLFQKLTFNPNRSENVFTDALGPSKDNARKSIEIKDLVRPARLEPVDDNAGKNNSAGTATKHKTPSKNSKIRKPQYHIPEEENEVSSISDYSDIMAPI